MCVCVRVCVCARVSVCMPVSQYVCPCFCRSLYVCLRCLQTCTGIRDRGSWHGSFEMSLRHKLMRVVPREGEGVVSYHQQLQANFCSQKVVCISNSLSIVDLHVAIAEGPNLKACPCASLGEDSAVPFLRPRRLLFVGDSFY